MTSTEIRLDLPGRIPALLVSRVGADADLSHTPIGDCAMANESRSASDLEFGAFQPAHLKPGAWLKSASAPTTLRPGRSRGKLPQTVVAMGRYGAAPKKKGTDDFS